MAECCGEVLVGPRGYNGWTPQFAVVERDAVSAVLQLIGWTGGEGTMPGNVGDYISTSGYTNNINLATNIKGPQGLSFLSDSGDPNILGASCTASNDGQFYIDVLTGDIFTCNGNTGIWDAAPLGSLVGPTGASGANGANGTNGTNGTNGLSAYEIWLAEGNVGTINDYLTSLIGADGQSAYELWLSLGNVGTPQDFLDSLIPATPDANKPVQYQIPNTNLY
jgi:hypothetical protein